MPRIKGKALPRLVCPRCKRSVALGESFPEVQIGGSITFIRRLMNHKDENDVNWCQVLWVDVDSGKEVKFKVVRDGS